MDRKGVGERPIMFRTVLGIDVSKASLHACLLPGDRDQPAWQRTFANTPHGRNQLLAAAPAAAVWVLEPTGRYHLAAVEAALEAGRQVLSAAPRRAMLYLRSRDLRAKTDRVDSLGLAWYGRTQELPAFAARNQVIDELHDLLAARKGLSLGRARLAQQAAELAYGQAPLQAAIAALDEQLRQVDARLAQLSAQPERLPDLRRLQTIPGVGPVTAGTLLARLAVGRFERADSFVAYAGLDIQVRQSGRSQGQAKLSRNGDAELRRLLYLAAMTACRRADSPFRQQFERERAKGLSTTAAYNVIARRLAALAWSLHRHQTDYDPARVHAQGGEARSELRG